MKKWLTIYIYIYIIRVSQLLNKLVNRKVYMLVNAYMHLYIVTQCNDPISNQLKSTLLNETIEVNEQWTTREEKGGNVDR